MKDTEYSFFLSNYKHMVYQTIICVKVENTVLK